MSSTDLDEVSRTIGIDLDGLRAKYQGIKAGTAPKEDSEKAKAAAEAFRKLDKYSTCAECGGSGLKKSVYNFMTIEANCDHCDGDGLLLKAVKEIQKDFESNKEQRKGGVGQEEGEGEGGGGVGGEKGGNAKSESL